MIVEKWGAPGERDADTSSIIKMHPKHDKAFPKKSKKCKTANLDDHRVWGRNLRIIREGLLAIEVDIQNAYGKTCVHGIANRLSKALKIIDEERSNLEDLMFENCRGELLHLPDNQVLSIYYGDSPASPTIYDEVHEHGRKRYAENAERQHEQILKKCGVV